MELEGWASPKMIREAEGGGARVSSGRPAAKEDVTPNDSEFPVVLHLHLLPPKYRLFGALCLTSNFSSRALGLKRLTGLLGDPAG